MKYWIEDVSTVYRRGRIESFYTNYAVKHGYVGITISYEKNVLENILNNIITADKNPIILGNGSINFCDILLRYSNEMNIISKNFHNCSWMQNHLLYPYQLATKGYTALKTILNVSKEDFRYGKEIFIKPINHKSFNGMVFKFGDDFYSSHYNKFKFSPNVNEHEQIVITEVVDIYQEYRFIVIDGKIVTWGQYKGIKSDITDNEYDIVCDIANKASIYDKAFALDIARTANGIKMIEINPFWCSGVYPEMDCYIIASKIDELVSLL